MNILIVAPDPSTQRLLQTHLHDWGYTAVFAKDPADAAELLRSASFDLVMSHKLPGEEKTAALYFLIANPSGAEAPNHLDIDDVLLTPIDLSYLRIKLQAAKRAIDRRNSLLAQVAELTKLNEQISSAYASLHSELQAASELQLSLLPAISDIHPNFCLDWLVMPSRFLAGDNLNYFMMQDRYLIFYHLDVAGHGIASALLSVTLNQLLSPQPGSPMVRFDPNLELKRLVPPVDVVSELNRRFQPQGDGYFTMIYAVLDTETGEIRMCQAGHPSPIKFHSDGTTSLVGNGGFPVGLWPDMTYEEIGADLLPGERLLLYSDGILACLNENNVPYSIDQLQDVIRKRAGQPTRQVLEAVKADIEVWCNGRDFPDDISMLIVECK